LAGQRAVRLSANAEAVDHLTTALQLIESLSSRADRADLELAVLMTLGVSLIAAKGYAAPEVGNVYGRARELCRTSASEARRLFPVLTGLFIFYHVRGDLRSGFELAQEMFVLADGVRDSSLLVEASFARGTALLFAGDFASSRDEFERGIATYDSRAHRSLCFVYGHDPGVYCLSLSCWALWVLGYPAQALARSEHAVRLAREVGHSFSLASCLHWSSVLHQQRREPRQVDMRAGEAIALSDEQGFAFFFAWAPVQTGWAAVHQGRGAEGIAEIRNGLGSARATGAENALPMGFATLVEACLETGQTQEGLSAVSEAFEIATRHGDRWYEPELHRLRGELLLASKGDDAEAELCFRRSIDIARRQQAKSWELRAMTSLARLLQRRGTQREAGSMLGEVYGWFTEGFDTADLKDAKALLDELSN
jgi:predicted ATPase